MSDMSVEELRESVRSLIDREFDHLHLNQHKTYTLFSIACHYMLYQAKQNPGQFLIRVQDGVLAEKLAKRSKDAMTRRLMSGLVRPRKMSSGDSTFYLDYFIPSSWGLTQAIDPKRFRGAIVVYREDAAPLVEEEHSAPMELVHFSLCDHAQRVIAIGQHQSFDDVETHKFACIAPPKDFGEGVTIYDDVDDLS